MRSLVVFVGLVLGLVLGFQNCSGPTFSGGAGGEKQSLSTTSGDPKLETPLGDTKREVGGEGYTGKIYVQLGTCGEEKDAVMFMVRVNEDQTATVLKENCASGKLRLLARNQYTVNVIDATSATLTYTTLSGEPVTVPSYKIPAPAASDLEKISGFIMLRRVDTGSEYRQDFNALPDPADGITWNGFGALATYSKPTATRLPLYQCRETTGDQLFYMWNRADCAGGELRGFLGYLEPVATPDTTLAYYVCYQANGVFMVAPEALKGWCGTAITQTLPPSVPALSEPFLLGYGPPR